MKKSFAKNLKQNQFTNKKSSAKNVTQDIFWLFCNFNFFFFLSAMADAKSKKNLRKNSDAKLLLRTVDKIKVFDESPIRD